MLEAQPPFCLCCLCKPWGLRVTIGQSLQRKTPQPKGCQRGCFQGCFAVLRCAVLAVQTVVTRRSYHGCQLPTPGPTSGALLAWRR